MTELACLLPVHDNHIAYTGGSVVVFNHVLVPFRPVCLTHCVCMIGVDWSLRNAPDTGAQSAQQH